MSKVKKRPNNYHENGSLGMDALAKHVEKDDSAKCGLIDSMGRRQKTIVINESGQGAGGPELKSSAVMAGF